MNGYIYHSEKTEIYLCFETQNTHPLSESYIANGKHMQHAMRNKKGIGIFIIVYMFVIDLSRSILM